MPKILPPILPIKRRHPEASHTDAVDTFGFRAIRFGMKALNIIPYAASFQSQVIDLSVKAWSPVFLRTKGEVPSFVYDAFYPQGWQARQVSDVTTLLETEPENVWLGLRRDELVGFIGIRLHPEDQMGEIYILAVSPDHQRQGIARTLMQFAEQRIRASGLKMVMVETTGDSGHAPARLTYEASGYERWPVARYFKRL